MSEFLLTKKEVQQSTNYNSVTVSHGGFGSPSPRVFMVDDACEFEPLRGAREASGEEFAQSQASSTLNIQTVTHHADT